MKRMRVFFLAVLLGALGLGSGLRADDADLPASKAQVRREIITVIEGQLAAFRKHDLPRAYTLAAAGLRAQVAPARFAEMVKSGYPAIWNNVRAEYGLVRDDGESAVLHVRVTARDGESEGYSYILFKDPDGWRIAQVVADEADDEPST
jgi:hypothetical protein